MMKEVCAQCLQRHVDPATGEQKEIVFSCFNQDQKLDEMDWDNLAARLRQNTVAEKLTGLWLERLLARPGRSCGRSRSTAAEPGRAYGTPARNSRYGLIASPSRKSSSSGTRVIEKCRCGSPDHVPRRADVADDVSPADDLLADREPAGVAREVAVEEEVLPGRVLLVDRDAAPLLPRETDDLPVRRGENRGAPGRADVDREVLAIAAAPIEERVPQRLGVHPSTGIRRLAESRSPRSTSSAVTRAAADLGRRNEPIRLAIVRNDSASVCRESACSAAPAISSDGCAPGTSGSSSWT